ncbi:hypothetical protein ACLOJK_016427 [Asimina triloba]
MTEDSGEAGFATCCSVVTLDSTEGLAAPMLSRLQRAYYYEAMLVSVLAGSKASPLISNASFCSVVNLEIKTCSLASGLQTYRSCLEVSREALPRQ